MNILQRYTEFCLTDNKQIINIYIYNQILSKNTISKRAMTNITNNIYLNVLRI